MKLYTKEECWSECVKDPKTRACEWGGFVQDPLTAGGLRNCVKHKTEVVGGSGGNSSFVCLVLKPGKF